MRASFAQLGPGSRVLVGWASTPEAANHPGRADKAYIARNAVSRALTHAPTLAVSDAGALVPTFFASPGKQIVRWRPAYRTFIGQDAPISERALLEEALGLPSVHAPEAAAPYWRDWTHNFDYLYLLMPKDEPNPLPQILQAAFAGRRFSLYRIHPQP